ncbi:MAG: NAD(+)/NADH kinase [Sphaerochaetaceae bacterium]|jgi:NAD+ kinase
MNKVIILVNQHKDNARLFAKEVDSYMKEHSISSEVVLLNGSDVSIDPTADVAISLGGDGTVLSCVRYLYPHSIPILAVNLGTFGFITEIGLQEWKEAFELFKEGKATISERLLVHAQVIRDNNIVYEAHGLNEMSISSRGLSKMVNLDLLIDGTHTGNVRGDGMLVATPTGSTGYSLASGGPILDVDLDALIVNPINPFALSNRPLVVHGDSIVTLHIREGQRTEVSLSVDGQLDFPLLEKDRLVIRRSDYKARVIMSPNRNFYEVVRDKLNWSGALHA